MKPPVLMNHGMLFARGERKSEQALTLSMKIRFRGERLEWGTKD